jgi:hypothetical protein
VGVLILIQSMSEQVLTAANDWARFELGFPSVDDHDYEIILVIPAQEIAL